jgi:photosystem II stability/assembly factor-like uncharacterized protein
MKKTIALNLFIQIALFNYAQSWTPLNSGSSYNFTDCCFVNADTGYVSGFFPWGEYRVPFVYKTTDGGSTFSYQQLDYGVTWWQAICFVNESKGFLVGDAIRVTSDGGNFWNTVLDMWMISGTLHDITFSTPLKGYTVGEDWYQVPLFYKTIDGGNTWNSYPIVSEATAITSISSPAEGILYTGANSYSTGIHTFSKSTDDGATWTQTSFTQNIFTLCFISTNNGFAGTDAGIFKTTNGGANWTSVLTTISAVNSIDINNGFGFAVCNDGSIYQTTDNGDNWIPVISPVQGTKVLNAVSVVSPQCAYTAGSTGTILKFSAPFVGIESQVANSESILMYPNPVKDLCTIKLEGIALEGISVHLYNLLGQAVLKVENIIDNTVNLDLSSLEGGFYFYSIENKNNVIMTSKFVKE